MFEVHFFEDKQGRQPIKEVLIDLRDKAKNSKDARVQYNKILAYIRSLEEYGTRIGEPVVKHIDGELWELRPLSHRIFFFYWREKKIFLTAPLYKENQQNAAKRN